MRLRLRIVLAVIVAFGAGCGPKPAELQKALASEDPAKREQAAKALQQIYAKDPAALGDHGKDYWLDVLTPSVTGKLSAEARKQARASASPIPYNEGPVDCCVVPSKLDELWVATLKYERLDNAGMPTAGAYIGFEKLERDPKMVQAPYPPPSFVGTTTIYYSTGAVARVVDYRADKTARTREYYVEGSLREDRLYSSDARAIPVGPLVHYFPNGTVAYEQRYTDGKREGAWKTWNERGVLELCVEYKADQEVSRGCP